MNRRGFLGLLARGAVGACVVAKIPTAILPAQVRTTAALDYLRVKYNDYTRGMSLSSTEGWPGLIVVGRELFDAAEGEVVSVQLFTSFVEPAVHHIMFKGTPLLAYDGSGLRGWDIRIVPRRDKDKAMLCIEAKRPMDWPRIAA